MQARENWGKKGKKEKKGQKTGLDWGEKRQDGKKVVQEMYLDQGNDITRH